MSKEKKLGQRKKDNFIRLGEQRTNKVLKAIDVLGHLSNQQLYEYTDEEVSQIFQAIEKRLEVTKVKFKGSEFKLIEGERKC